MGLAALSAAARSQDGRGPKTTLERAVPAHFGIDTPRELAEEIHLGRLPPTRSSTSRPWSSPRPRSTRSRPTSRKRLAAEVVALARVALTRLELTGRPVEVLLGGGVLQAGDGHLVDAIAAGLREVGPEITVRATDVPPILGTALLGLDDLRAGADAQARLRRELVAAVGAREESSRHGRRPLRAGDADLPGRRAPGRRSPRPAHRRGRADGAGGALGVGKSTALRMLAGLEEVDAGAIQSAPAT